ncbi:UBX domain-containing protein 10 [Sceloporus undulatus]|uniref:UBX domain-containing protein 10 n=1 Tax=Sceloporus undulatus TaxID=8520 RepID=UPI001C4B7EBE|nr:UBX domain-containing protein 10 [Sceloporus undulatus]XP_042333670.1 UBX domain-containing protein 10 [Sceloporus undulatus]
MAAASHLDIASSERKTSFGVAKPSAWPPQPLAMHVTRPKSAKGRTRPHLQYSQSVKAYSSQVPLSPQPLAIPAVEVPSGRRVSPSQLARAVPAEIPDLLQQVPLRMSSSLNKYRVLPSISRKELSKSGPEGMSGQAGQSAKVEEEEEEEEQSFRDRSLMGKLSSQRGPKGGSGESMGSPPPPSKARPLSKTREGDLPLSALNLEEPSAEEPRLLLAIRSPSGQRFERHFKPTDSLKTVLAVAAQKNSATYRHCSIETVEVPRRTFSDLSKSLAECAIPHKSVLCILRGEQDGEP